ncbi:MAG TPA: hypothetical protein VKY39_05465, partial [Aggregatilineales bacterium]|nr:hypothetical protein [Aggregatilineales bacterium]
MTDHNEEKKQLSRRDALILGGGSLAGLILGGCAQPAPAPATNPPAAPAATEAGATAAPAEAAAVEPVAQQVVNLNTTPVAYVGRTFDKCSGCRLCEITCSEFHEGKIWPAASRVRVHEYYPGLEFPVLCYQCGNAPCADAC